MRTRLYDYFMRGVSPGSRGLIGVEVETLFVDRSGEPLSNAAASVFFERAVTTHGWSIDSSYEAEGRQVIDTIRDTAGNIIGKEIGSCNIELATIPLPADKAIPYTRERLDELYGMIGHRKYRGAILQAPRSSLLPTSPSAREVEFLRLDGAEVTNMMASTSAVQFTLDTEPGRVIGLLNKLGSQIARFREDYPQDAYWQNYVRKSKAGYREDRYGGPLNFESMFDYCARLAEHEVIAGSKLVPHELVPDADIRQFIKSIWWYFRIKRYGDQLCVEVRPLARRSDACLQEQLDLVLEIACG